MIAGLMAYRVEQGMSLYLIDSLSILSHLHYPPLLVGLA